MNSRVDLAGSRILLVDDTPENLKVLRQTLEAEGYNIMVATSGETAIKIAYDASPDLILLDVLMPGIDGFETCRRLKSHPATVDIPVLFVTARAETTSVVEGFAAGGVDYIVKPFQNEEVLIRVQTHLSLDRLSRELTEKNRELTDTNHRLEEEIAQRKVLSAEKDQLAEHLSILSNQEAKHWGVDGIIGESPIIRETLQNIERLKNAETTVLITGESGTGKELFARAIHHRSSRSSGPFLPLNCSTIPPELAESTLFGHIRGAFTGAEKDRRGYFELAHGGTLFLDEIGDMTPDIQAKLLRVLEDGKVVPVGTGEEKAVDVRIIAATHRDLQSEVTSPCFLSIFLTCFQTKWVWIRPT
jgi:DNA-binding NtrC family response regulator